jgi:hypothetical protein
VLLIEEKIVGSVETQETGAHLGASGTRSPFIFGLPYMAVLIIDKLLITAHSLFPVR